MPSMVSAPMTFWKKACTASSSFRPELPQGHEQLVLLPFRHLAGGKFDVHQVLPQGARQGALEDAQEFLALLLAHQGQGLVELGHDLSQLVDIAAPHMGDAGLIGAKTAADLRNFFFVHGVLHFQSGFQAAVSPDAADIIVDEFPAGRNADFCCEAALPF